MENVIEIKNLNKKYEDFSLNGITLDIPKRKHCRANW